MSREEVLERFRQVVARGLVRAEREHAAHLARIRAMPKLRVKRSPPMHIARPVRRAGAP